jgi:hypothetical protein
LYTRFHQPPVQHWCRVTIDSTELIFDKIFLLYNNALVQIPNNVNNPNWIDNINKSKAMKERPTFSVSAGISFADTEALRKEMEAFVQEPENVRDYQPEIDIELISAGDLSKLDLRVELQHKVRILPVSAVEIGLTRRSQTGRTKSSRISEVQIQLRSPFCNAQDTD